MPDQHLQKFDLKPHLDDIRVIRQQIGDSTQQYLDQKHQQYLLLAITEWASNLIKHPSRLADHIEVILEKKHKTLQVTIIDNGESFKHFNTAFDNAELIIDNVLHASGRGLGLMKTLVSEINYQEKFQDEYNYLSFSVPLASTKPVIAIIEDDIALASLLITFIKDHYQVTYYSKPTDFLQQLTSSSYDLIISDINMPGMDGLALKKHLSLDKVSNLIPFLFLTGEDSQDIEDQASDLGIDDYLKKPISKQALLRVIKRVLSRKTQERQQMGDLLDEKVTALLRPKLPEKIQDKQIANAFQHASAGGGDFIIHIPADDKDIIILADVMGHGLDAKFYAHNYAGYIQGLIQTLDKSDSLASFFSKLSKIIHDDTRLESVILTCIGISISKSGKISLVNAGHPKPLTIIDNQLQEINISGELMGIRDNSNYDEIDLPNNVRRLILYTDGLIEVGQNHEERIANKKIILDSITHSQSDDINTALDSVMKTYHKLNQHQRHDDMTLIMLDL